ITKAGAVKPAVIIQRDEYAKVERYGELAYTLRNLLFQNTVNNRIQNLFVFKRHVAAVPCYHKGYNRDNSFVWLADNRHQHINSRTFASSFRRTTKKHLSYSLGLAFLRHLLTAFARRNGGSKGQGLHVLSPNKVLNFVNQAKANSREMQASYTAATAKVVYALQSQLYSQLSFNKEETRLSYVNLRQILKVNLGLHLRFRGLQQAVVRKSLAFLLPACCPGFGQQFGQDDFNKTCTILLASLEDLSKPDLIKLIHYKLHSQVKTFWQSTSRGNLRYKVKELSAPFSIPLLTSYVRREEGKELSTSLGCSCYYRGLPKAERTVIQTSFSTAKRAVLVATVAFVAGGIGRGRRNRQTCVARIVMQQILNCNYCLRIPINLYLNRDSKQIAAYDGPLVDQACTASLRKRNRPLSLISSSPLARRDKVSRAAAKAARTNNCIKCFMDGQAYNYPKGSCNCLIGPIVRYYKDNRIGGKLGTSMCYSCAMPLDLCQCTYNRLVAKDIWLQRIRKESNSTLDRAKEADFVSYFRQVLRFTHQYPYFITADKSKALLGSLL
ncbi:hypothetical protein K504DRAFT_468350, partial [Pleomassaria siparia CBS 279.74]